MKIWRLLLGFLVGIGHLAMAAAKDDVRDGILVVSVGGALTESRSREVVGQIQFLSPDVRAITVVIDSDGGALPDVFAVADALQGARVPTFAYVRNAVATAVFIAAACDTIVSDEKGVIGGPGIVPREMLVFEDEIFSAIARELTRKLAGYAGNKNHDVGIFTAMVDPKQVLRRGGREWKGTNQILALTAREMLALSIAASQWASVDAFVASLKKKPNQTKELMPTAVTTSAEQKIAPASGVAQL